MLKIGYFRQYIGNTCKVLKCGAGEGWRILFRTDYVGSEGVRVLHESK
jgi:hypothetical protein